jgi:hypothetical protein
LSTNADTLDTAPVQRTRDPEAVWLKSDNYRFRALFYEFPPGFVVHRGM